MPDVQKEIKWSNVVNIAPDLGICHSRNSWWQSEDPDFFRARNGAGKDAPGQRRVRISGRIPAAIFPA
jgi:hypothetical protein